MDDIIEDKIKIINLDGAKEYLKDIKYPVYFLDFEAINNNKEWLFKKGLAIDQQLSSFSILRINDINDDETKIKHFSMVGKKENYKEMAKSITDFYKEKGTVIVWGRDLELRGLGKLMKESNESYHKKIALMICNMVDLQLLFHSGSFINLTPNSKSSLETISKSFNSYKSANIKDGKKVKYLLEYTHNNKLDSSYLKKILKRVKEYNNSDVINIKRIFVEINNLIF